MRVLKPGREQKGWATEIACSGEGNGGGGCNALLLVEQGDVFVTARSLRDEMDTFNTFRCPCCNVWTDISKAVRVPFKARNHSMDIDGPMSGVSPRA